MKFTVAKKDIVTSDVTHEIEKVMKSKKNKGKALANLASILTKASKSDGVIIVTKDDEGFNFGVYNLATEEIKEAACILIHLGYNDFKSF